MREDPLVGPLPGAGWPPPGAFPPLAVRRDRLWVGLERLGAKVARGSGRELYSAPSPGPRRFPGPWTQCSLRPLSPRGGTGPPAPGATADRGGLSSVRPDRVASPGRGSAHVKGVRGLRRCRQPTRPVLKHGPRSLTRARVRGWNKPRGAMKVRAGARRLRLDPGPAGSGAPPARLARTVGEVERERVR